MSKLFVEFGFSDIEKQIKYGKEFLFVARLYSRFISEINIKDLRKITIQLVNSNEKNRVIASNKMTKVCLIYRYFEWQSIDNEPLEKSRYKIILDLILDSILETSKKFNWPTEIFKNAYFQSIKSGFKNEYVLIPNKSSPDRRFIASLSVVVDKEYSSIFIHLIDKKNDNKIKIKKLISVSFYENDLSNIARSLKWNNNEEFIVSNNREEINFKFSVQRNVSEIFLTPQTNDENYLKEELKLLNPKTTKDEFLKIINRRIENLSM